MSNRCATDGLLNWALLLTLAGCAVAAPVTGGAAEPRSEAPSGEADEACVSSTAEVCFDARDNNCNGIADEGCGLRSGLVQFLIAWTDPEVDVELDVYDPAGQLAEVGSVTVSGLTKERDCPGQNEACRGAELENVVLEADREPMRGEYRVSVRWANVEQIGAWYRAGPGSSEVLKLNFAARLGPKSISRRIQLSHGHSERQFRFSL